MEIWKDIKGFEGSYEINRNGEVRRIKRKVKGYSYLKSTVMKIGYCIYAFSVKGKVTKHYMHRLVAEHFIENPEGYNYVNHLNGIKTDNRVENLEWCTQSRNIQHSFDTGLQPNGEKHHACTRLTEEDAKMIKYGYPDLGDRAVAKIYSIHHAHVYYIRKGKTWKHI